MQVEARVSRAWQEALLTEAQPERRKLGTVNRRRHRVSLRIRFRHSNKTPLARRQPAPTFCQFAAPCRTVSGRTSQPSLQLGRPGADLPALGRPGRHQPLQHRLHRRFALPLELRLRRGQKPRGGPTP